MNKEIESTRAFYNTSYLKNGFNAQRRYPNEELCRFMGRNFFSIPQEKRQDIKILETGCGSGANLWMIAREGFNTYGIDLSEASLTLCEEMLRQYNTQAKLSAQDMSVMNFDYNTFDAVVDVFSSYCLNFKNGSGYVQNIFNILKPGGLFFSYFPSKRSDAYQYHEPAHLLDSSTLNSILRQDSPYHGQLYPFRFIHPQEYQHHLINQGFKVQYLETVSRTYNSMRETFEFVVIEAVKE
ncbi:MAG: class I SAM-dependent methyltransferase [Proteobacteria bacterium]|nr:class I SAM-dependent methyltransferase [Pseudomonadota bacterium]